MSYPLLRPVPALSQLHSSLEFRIDEGACNGRVEQFFVFDASRSRDMGYDHNISIETLCTTTC